MSQSEDFPAELHYTQEHEWLRREGKEVVVGITRFAADQLGDVVFVELPEVGASVVAGRPLGVVESVKSVSDLFAPLSGTVLAVNANLRQSPEKVNEDPYGEGWMLRILPTADSEEGLLSAADYQTLVA